MAFVACPRCGKPMVPEVGCCADSLTPSLSPDAPTRLDAATRPVRAADSTIPASSSAAARALVVEEIEQSIRLFEEPEIIGKRLGRYQVEAMLGKGGMGAVYRVRHTELGTLAAVKVLDSKLLQSPEVGMRFFQEAKAAAQIGHHNIVQVIDFARHPQIGSYIVMELLEGITLGKLIESRRSRGLAPAHAVTITLQVCDALSAAHRLGIVHRDLKPENVFLLGGDIDHIKLMDFGVAKISQDASVVSTRPGAILGTPQYMSPEQWDGGQIDQRTDVAAYAWLQQRLPDRSPRPAVS